MKKTYQTQDGKTTINVSMDGEKTKTIVKTQKEVIYFRESAIQSVIADLTSFGLVVGGLLLNHTYLHARWYIDIFFLFIFFVLISSRGANKAKRFTDLQKFKDYVKEMK